MAYLLTEPHILFEGYQLLQNWQTVQYKDQPVRVLLQELTATNLTGSKETYNTCKLALDQYSELFQTKFTPLVDHYKECVNKLKQVQATVKGEGKIRQKLTAINAAISKVADRLESVQRYKEQPNSAQQLPSFWPQLTAQLKNFGGDKLTELLNFCRELLAFLDWCTQDANVRYSPYIDQSTQKLSSETTQLLEKADACTKLYQQLKAQGVVQESAYKTTTNKFVLNQDLPGKQILLQLSTTIQQLQTSLANYIKLNEVDYILQSTTPLQEIIGKDFTISDKNSLARVKEAQQNNLDIDIFTKLGLPGQSWSTGGADAKELAQKYCQQFINGDKVDVEKGLTLLTAFTDYLQPFKVLAGALQNIKYDQLRDVVQGKRRAFLPASAAAIADDQVSLSTITTAHTQLVDAIDNFKATYQTEAAPIVTWLQQLQQILDQKNKVDWDQKSRDKNREKQSSKTIRAAQLKDMRFQKQLWSQTGPYGKDGQQLQKLGRAFITCLEFKGFTAKQNPVLAFLLGTDKQGSAPDRPKMLPYVVKWGKFNYVTFHNLIANNVITSKELRGKGVLGLKDIIFNPGLWTVDRRDFQQYINYQGQLVTKINSNKLTVQQAVQILYDGSGKLRTLATIRRALAAVGGSVDLNKLQKRIQVLVKDFTTNNRPQEEVKRAILYYLQHSASTPAAKQIKQVNAITSKLTDKYRLTLIEQRQLMSIVGGQDLDQKQLRKIATTLFPPAKTKP